MVIRKFLFVDFISLFIYLFFNYFKATFQPITFVVAAVLFPSKCLRSHSFFLMFRFSKPVEVTFLQKKDIYSLYFQIY